MQHICPYGAAGLDNLYARPMSGRRLIVASPSMPQVSASSSDDKLQYDVIIAALGARYNMYCANVTRTLLVDPSKQQEAEYK